LIFASASGAVSASRQDQGALKGSSGGVRFEVASVRPSAASTQIARSYNPGRFQVKAFTLIRLVSLAYGVAPVRIILPEWASRARFDVEATMPAGTTAAQQPEMLRALLEERFSIRARREFRTMEVLLLQRVRSDGRLGPQLVQVQRDCSVDPKVCSRSEPPGEMHLLGRKWEDIRLADFLESSLETVVLDRTKLSGQFDLRLTWQPTLTARPDTVNDGDQRPATIQLALREQLGLKLEKGREGIEVLVITEIAMPSPN
jgi:uncharacterized protein (TIGR03435 family)